MVKVILVSILWILASVSEVYAESGMIKVNPSVGYMKFDGDSELKSKVLPVIGVEYMLSDTYSVSLTFSHAGVNIRDVREDASVSLYYLDGLYYLLRDKHWHPYLVAGVGHRRMKFDFSDQSTKSNNETDTQLHVGGGVRYDVNNKFTVRSEVRVLQNLHNDGTDALLSFGVSRAFGS
ncbi:hypothetical protein A9Q81_04205 [Gammaproteobacteria bacterium 42_54_T18]|nr:hypothetical protein A9Q81_04205 [Gammaproteobacteria bacterium 42_54_T18]